MKKSNKKEIENIIIESLDKYPDNYKFSKKEVSEIIAWIMEGVGEGIEEVMPKILKIITLANKKRR